MNGIVEASLALLLLCVLYIICGRSGQRGQLNRDLREGENKVEMLQSSRSDQLLSFGGWMPHLVRTVREAETHFRKPPKGPLGMYDTYFYQHSPSPLPCLYCSIATHFHSLVALALEPTSPYIYLSPLVYTYTCTHTYIHMSVSHSPNALAFKRCHVQTSRLPLVDCH